MNDLTETIRELAPTGVVRAAINYGNPVLAQRDPETGEPRGVAAAIAREIARRLGRPHRFVTFDAAGKAFAALQDGAWDVAFLAIDPKRGIEIDFTRPYVIIEASYMVRSGSLLRGIDDVDAPGQRIAVGAGSAYELFLTRNVRHAEIVRAPTGNEAIEMFLRDGLEAVAGVKSPLQRRASGDEGLRVMDGSFMSIEQAVAIPKGRTAALLFAQATLDDLIASGFIVAELERSGQRDALVPGR
jgi:polar amino acid transport system substrate-binding protein